jgi:type II secretory pathway pseudopilin PulG
MKAYRTHSRGKYRQGFTLLEISFVMALIIGLSVGMGLSISAMKKWKRGKEGALALQAVYAAQRAYMADHPVTDPSTLTSALLIPYLPQNYAAMPVVKGLEDQTLAFDVAVMPPRLLNGTATYDPSGKSNDNLWDVGE